MTDQPYTGRIEVLRNRVAELEKALEPFAEFGHERKHVWEEDFATARRVLYALEATTPVQEWEGPLTDEEQGMIDAAWETHKAARPQFLNTEDGEFNGNETTPPAPKVTECEKCQDSGYVERSSGGHWTGGSIKTTLDFCDCECGEDARTAAQEEGR